MEKKIRKVLSFDVGIINLAYCILEINDDDKTFKINGWGIINLADNRQTCNFIKNTGEMCDKIAKHCVKVDEHNRYYYCKAHVGKAELCIKNINVKWWDVLPEDVEQCKHCLKSGEKYSNILPGQYCRIHQKKAMSENKLTCATKKCNEHVTFGLHLAKPMVYVDEGEEQGELSYKYEHGWCTDHYDDEYRDYLKKKTKKMSQNSNKISLYYLGASMYKKLDLLPELLQVDEVLVENQPTFINPTMKSVSSMLYSYFVMRAIHEKDKTGSTIQTVNFCSPSNKIKVGGVEAGQRLENAEVDKVYKVTKDLGVRFCKALISDNVDWVKTLESHKKKDDLADAFLQGFIMNFGPKLPEHYAKKIRDVDTNIHQKKELEIDYEIKCKPISIDINVSDDALLNDINVDDLSKEFKSINQSLPIINKANNETDDITIRIGRVKNPTSTVIDISKPKYYKGSKRYYKKPAI
jgi:hypothetical protein